MEYLRELIRNSLRTFRENRLIRVIAGLLVVILATAMVIFEVENVNGNGSFGGIGDTLWWALVTMFTVGYGDITPITALGRTLAVVIMVSGISLTAIFTATIASYFVEKRIREGKGMEDIKSKDHIIICGWNTRAMRIMDIIAEWGPKSLEVVLVNELPEEQIASILKVCKVSRVRHVRGDHVHEGVLQRANVTDADAALLLIDKYGGKPGASPDDRTVLAAFTIKGINPKVAVYAEVESHDRISQLKRAGVDIIAPLGAHNDFLLSNALLNPGVTTAVQEMLSYGRGQTLQQRSIPHSLVEKTFGEALMHFRRQGGSLLVGLVHQEEEGMGLDDILSGDMSAIDRFIKKKFEGLEQAYFSKRTSLKVNLNPPDNYIIKPKDVALVIASEERKS